MAIISDSFTIDDPPEPAKPPVPRERLLWLSVLVEAKEDLVNPNEYHYAMRDHGIKEPYIDAKTFFFGEDKAIRRHFEFVCGMAGVNVEAVIDSARRQLARRYARRDSA